ncbi:hypothetical protein ACFPRL_23145 [Pseudoclavibacter helvolus]
MRPRGRLLAKTQLRAPATALRHTFHPTPRLTRPTPPRPRPRAPQSCGQAWSPRS